MTIEELQKKINDPTTPQGEIDDLKLELRQKQHRKKIKEREEYEEKHKVSVYGSDDYVGASAGEYSFYYGYEATKCPVKSHKTDEECYEKDCEKREWLFQVEKNGETIFEKTTSELHYPETDDIERILIAGICHFIKTL